MLRSSSHMTYSGVSFEKLLCLIPLGSALTVVAVVHFQPSVNRDIAICVESLRNLTFKDSLQRVSIGPAYARVSQLIATVTRSGMAFSVLTVYRHLAKAMSETTYMAHDGGEWRALCHSVLRTCQTYQVNAVMPRDLLDDTMSSLRRMMDQEADDRGLDISFGESFMPSSMSPLQDRPLSAPGAAPMPPYGQFAMENAQYKSIHNNAAQPVIGAMGCTDGVHPSYGYEPDIYEECGNVDVIITHNMGRPVRKCPCGVDIPFATDFCVVCKQFMPGTKVCKECRAPRFRGLETCCHYGAGILGCHWHVHAQNLLSPLPRTNRWLFARFSSEKSWVHSVGHCRR